MAFVICGTAVHWEDDGYERSIQLFCVQGNERNPQLRSDDGPPAGPRRDWYFYVAGDFLEDEDPTNPIAAVRFEEVLDQPDGFYINRRGAYTNEGPHIGAALKINSRTHDAIYQLNRFAPTLIVIGEDDLYCASPTNIAYEEADGEYWTADFDVGIIGDMQDDGMWEMSSTMHFEDDELWVYSEDGT